MLSQVGKAANGKEQVLCLQCKQHIKAVGGAIQVRGGGVTQIRI